MSFWRALHFFCPYIFQLYHGENNLYSVSFKDIVGMNGRILIKYSKLCKNNSAMREWKKEWGILVC